MPPAASPPPPSNDVRLVVRKSARQLTVYDGPRAVKVYAVIVGKGPGDKVRESDQRTPEGDFYVCMKNPQSKYTLSLGLSYPDRDDAARGLRDGLISQQEHDQIVQALDNRDLPDWYTKLGGEIMIHGARDGRDGTAGCIAMDDDDIRELYPQVPLGAVVTILP